MRLIYGVVAVHGLLMMFALSANHISISLIYSRALRNWLD
jgi:hypothetical protein